MTRMERKNKETTKPLWIKETEGTLILRKPTYIRAKYKQKLRATVEELGNRVGEFKLLEKGSGKDKVTEAKIAEATAEPAPSKDAPKPEVYEAVHRGRGWYDVLSPEGTVMNEKKLKVAAAKDLVDELNSGGGE